MWPSRRAERDEPEIPIAPREYEYSVSVERGYSPGDILITSLALLASSRHQVRLTSSLTLFSCQLVDDFLGPGFLRVFSRSLYGTLILD